MTTAGEGRATTTGDADLCRDSGGAVRYQRCLHRFATKAAPVSGQAGRERGLSWVIATQLVSCISITFVALDPSLLHWFLIPVSLCGVLVGVDAADWMRRRLDTFAPHALLGMFGFRSRDTRLPVKILAPGLTVAAILVLTQDADNIVLFLFRHVVPLAVIAALATQAVPAEPELRQGAGPVNYGPG